MTLNQLRYFVGVADTLHFGQAAASLGMSQPALSQQITRLETSLGVSLFSRDKRRVSLTDAGRAMLERARRTIIESERAVLEARRVAARSPDVVRVGYFAPSGLVLLPRAVRRLGSTAAGVTVVPHEGYSPDLLHQLADGKLDIAVVRGPVVAEGLRSEPLVRERLVAVLPSEHPLARSRAVRLAALAAMPFVRCPRRTAPAFYDAVEAACEAAGFEPRLSIEASDWPAILSFVSAGLGVGILSESVAQFRRTGCTFRPIDGSRQEIDVTLTWRQGRVSSGTTRVLEALRAVSV